LADLKTGRLFQVAYLKTLTELYFTLFSVSPNENGETPTVLTTTFALANPAARCEAYPGKLNCLTVWWKWHWAHWALF